MNSAAGDVPRIRMITPIWGRSYIDRWLGFSFASLLSPGNLPYLNEHAKFDLAIVTRSIDAAYIKSLAVFHQLTAGIEVTFILIDDLFPLSGSTSYGVPLTLAYARGIHDLGKSTLGSYVIVMNADGVVASGSMRGLLKKIQKGATAISAQSVRTVDGKARSELLGKVVDGVLEIGPRELMRITFRNLHSVVTARILNERTIIDTTYYHMMYWRIADGCLGMRAFFLHPMCFRIERPMPKVLCPVDYGFLSEFCPSAQYDVMEDSDEFLIVELQDRDSESHLLRVAPRMNSLMEWLNCLSLEVPAQAVKWTTAEHRRCATRTLYYHDCGLPKDYIARSKPFDEFLEGILGRMPAPISHVGHPHWLPAVRTYREDLRRSGSDSAIDLLDDPRNE